MTRCTECLAIFVSVCSVISSALYTYVYIRGQQVSFFNEIHSDFASASMMDAFDLLESFQAATGEEKYAQEYIRLKVLRLSGLHQPQSTKSSPAESAIAAGLCAVCSSEADLAQRLDGARRQLLHYMDKLLMFKRMSYITQSMLDEFPGRSRMAHAVQLLEPLVEATAATYHISLEEHRNVLAGIKDAFGLSVVPMAREEQANASCEADGEACPARR